MYSISRKKKSLPTRWLFAFHDTSQKFFRNCSVALFVHLRSFRERATSKFLSSFTVQTMQLKAILFTLQKDLVLVGAIILSLFLNGLERTAFQSKVLLHADTSAVEITRHKRE